MDATLGIRQQFVVGGTKTEDGMGPSLRRWRSELRALPREPASSGEVTGADAVLGSDSDWRRRRPRGDLGRGRIGLLTATVDEEIESIFMDLQRRTPGCSSRSGGQRREVRERLG